jgi:hypothetical protein
MTPLHINMCTGVQIGAAVVPADKSTASYLFLTYAMSLPVKLNFQGFEDELAGLPRESVLDTGSWCVKDA